MFINPKDAPFAAVMAIALLATVRAFDEYPRAQPATIALFGVGIGLAIGSRVMGGFAILNALLPLTLLAALQARRNGMIPALREAAAFLVPFIPAVILAYLVMGLVWPCRSFRRSIRFARSNTFPTSSSDRGANCSTAV